MGKEGRVRSSDPRDSTAPRSRLNWMSSGSPPAKIEKATDNKIAYPGATAAA